MKETCWVDKRSLKFKVKHTWVFQRVCNWGLFKPGLWAGNMDLCKSVSNNFDECSNQDSICDGGSMERTEAGARLKSIRGIWKNHPPLQCMGGTRKMCFVFFKSNYINEQKISNSIAVLFRVDKVYLQITRRIMWSRWWGWCELNEAWLPMLGLVLARARSRDERGKKRPQEGNCHPDNRNNEPTQDYSEKIKKQNWVNLQKEKKTRSLIGCAGKVP